MPYDEAKHTAMVEKALDAIPNYPFRPCPICHDDEDCEHGIVERATGWEGMVPCDVCTLPVDPKSDACRHCG